MTLKESQWDFQTDLKMQIVIEIAMAALLEGMLLLRRKASQC